MCVCDVCICTHVTEHDTCGGKRTDSWGQMVLFFHYRIPREIKLRLLGLGSKLYLLSLSAGPRTSVLLYSGLNLFACVSCSSQIS